MGSARQPQVNQVDQAVARLAIDGCLVGVNELEVIELVAEVVGLAGRSSLRGRGGKLREAVEDAAGLQVDAVAAAQVHGIALLCLVPAGGVALVVGGEFPLEAGFRQFR